ncbi:MAG: agmatine deiminase family protein [Lentisphaerae bacterium]|nr:agmatine deiminase family protein [Lentisphaerota bacterium]
MSATISDRYRFPAEWEPHEATWIGWPHQTSDWPGRMGPIPWVFAEFVRALSPGERVRILVQSSAARARATDILKRAGVDGALLDWFDIPTNRNWTRDAGPIFVRSGRGRRGQVVVADFGFTAWAKYGNWRKDDAVAGMAARRLRLPRIVPEHQGRRVVLEGGAIDLNGRGALLTTEECLLDPKVQVRNPGFDRGDYEAVFQRYLGVTHTIWLGRGVAGDDTHGHVDDLCRFVNPTTVLLAQEANAKDANYRPLQENRERLQGVRLERGARVHMIPLPMPEPVVFEGQRLPASYANFYIGNAAVLVPTFNCPQDRQALGIVAECFPSRRVIGIHARDLIWGLGAIHCLTQQQPAP